MTTVGGATNFGDGVTNNTATVALSAASDIVTAAGASFTLTIPNHSLISGDTITLSGFAGAIGATPAAQLNASHIITYVDASHVLITVTTAHGIVAGANVGPGPGPVADIRLYQGNILDAASTTQTFLGQTGTSSFTSASKTFTITTAASSITPITSS